MRGNTTQTRTPAQLAPRTHFKGRRPKEKPEPFGRAPSNGVFGPLVKTVPPDLRALIDAGVVRRSLPA